MGSDEAMRAVVSQEVVDLLYLCGRALAGEAAELERVSRMDLARVHALAVSQGLSALAYYGLESALADGKPQSAPLAAWRSERDKSVRRQMLFGAERAQILAWLCDNGIWFAPLKGAVLADWYPRVGMREFSDNDFLYDATRRADVARFFKERGYARNADGHAAGMDDSYSKEPVYRFEMHMRLFSGYLSQEILSYFEGMENRLVSSDEECIARELQAMGLAEFAASLERLAACVFERNFEPSCLSAGDAEMLRALTSYGTYGTIEHQAELKVERADKQGVSTSGYVLGRIVPDDAWWDANFPFANKHRWARFPLLLFRYVRAAVEPGRRARIAAEVKALLHRK